jgi:hypothetical protein
MREGGREGGLEGGGDWNQGALAVKDAEARRYVDLNPNLNPKQGVVNPKGRGSEAICLVQSGEREGGKETEFIRICATGWRGGEAHMGRKS